jgi:tRNA U34 5-methylaminomethyl-2-thiouridine-forming methyltransferase MnmC
MWTLECLKKVYHACKTAKETLGTNLYTYSQATPVRFKLLQAGFYVGKGSATGLKADTTIASTHLNNLTEPLGARWADRLKNSDSPELQNEKENIGQLLKTHPQFTGQSAHN